MSSKTEMFGMLYDVNKTHQNASIQTFVDVPLNISNISQIITAFSIAGTYVTSCSVLALFKIKKEKKKMQRSRTKMKLAQ